MGSISHEPADHGPTFYMGEPSTSHLSTTPSTRKRKLKLTKSPIQTKKLCMVRSLHDNIKFYWLIKENKDVIIISKLYENAMATFLKFILIRFALLKIHLCICSFT